jgi:phosphoribosyl-AMP cyclohydrolase / phosphoribosyl-ATP pyrophosphohydrolase
LHVIIGTRAEPAFLAQLPRHRVIVALDVRDGAVMVDAWRQERAGALPELIKELEPYCAGFLVTDVSRDGTRSGIDPALLSQLKGCTTRRIIVSGGVTGAADVIAAAELGFDAVIGLAFSSGALDPEDAFVGTVDWSKGLVPTVVQDGRGSVLMLAYSSKESLHRSLSTRTGTYHSRRRDALWTKGETSGHTQRLLEVTMDCDRDSLLFIVDQTGPACHTARKSCFGRDRFSVSELQSYLQRKLHARAEDSYTARIGSDSHKLAKKVMEEAFELVDAGTRENRVYEAADLAYFALILLTTEGIGMDEIVNELSLRHQGRGYR